MTESTEKNKKIDFGAVIERLKAALRLQTDAALGRALGLQSTTFTMRKKAGTVPLEELTALCLANDLDLHWVLLGEHSGAPRPGGAAELARQAAQDPPAYGPIDLKLLTTCLRIVEEELDAKQMSVPADRRAKIVALMYDYLIARTERDEASFARFIEAVLP